MEDYQKRSRDFMIAGNQTVRDRPSEITDDEKVLRVRLILEEAMEFAEACGVNVVFFNQKTDQYVDASDKNFEVLNTQRKKFNIVEYADAIGDLTYVVGGAANCAGIDMEPIDKEIQRSNMDKFRNGVVRDGFGKVVKPDGWTAPDIKSEIDKQLNGR